MENQYPPLTEDHILYEDNHLLAVNKPARLLVQGDSTGDVDLIVLARDFLKKKYDKPGNVFTGLIHRIDRPVSGVVVLAKTSKALGRMTRLFKQRKVQKRYIALTWEKPEVDRGRLEDYLWKDRERNIVKVVGEHTEDAKKAELHYEVALADEQMNVLKVFPVTGRPHQIRVQLSHMGCPIIGDLKYGAPEPLPDQSIALHAWQLEFIHPVKKELLTITAPFPANNIWDQARQAIN